VKLLRASRIKCLLALLALLVVTPPVALLPYDLDLRAALDLAMTRAQGVSVDRDHLHAVELDLAVAVEIADVVAIVAHPVEHRVHREVPK